MNSAKPAWKRSAGLALVGALAFTVATFAFEAGAQDSSGVTSDLERTATTSPSEKIAYAQGALSEIRDAEKQIVRLLEQVRKDGDAEAIECTSNRLTSVRALLSVVEASDVSMRDALAAGLTEKANHEFRKIAVAVNKTRLLLAEAQRCATDQRLESGTTLVDWESALADEDDLDRLDLNDFDIGLDPPQVSPFL